MQQVVVVANQTAIGTHLTQRLHELKSESGTLAVHLVVPATQQSRTETDGEGRPVYDADGVERAKIQLRKATETIERIGVTVTGEVGSADPMEAIMSTRRAQRIDRVIVSTLPVGLSRWLAMDLPHRLRRRLNVPVEHIVGRPVEAEGGEADAATGPVKVLLIEDQPADIELARRAIDRAGIDHELTAAKNGAEAIAALQTYGVTGFDLLLLDLKMPVLDGHEFLEQANREIGLDGTTVAVLTTSSNDADRERAHALGANAYMVKDPDFDVFSEAVASLVREVHRAR